MMVKNSLKFNFWLLKKLVKKVFGDLFPADSWNGILFAEIREWHKGETGQFDQYI